MAKGIIYELRCCIADEWHPFYVGRTENAQRRLNEHRYHSLTGDTLVYQFIREVLTANSITWDLHPVAEYTDDYVDQEDEHIMRLLVEGVRLKNMKKGDAGWMARREAEADDMRKRCISSYRKYRAVVTLEEQEKRAAERHAQWVTEQETNKKRAMLDEISAEIQAQQAVIREKQRIKEQKRAEQMLAVIEHRRKQEAEWQTQQTQQTPSAPTIPKLTVQNKPMPPGYGDALVAQSIAPQTRLAAGELTFLQKWIKETQ